MTDTRFCIFEDCDQEPWRCFVYCEAHARAEVPAEAAAADLLEALRGAAGWLADYGRDEPGASPLFTNGIDRVRALVAAAIEKAEAQVAKAEAQAVHAMARRWPPRRA